MRLYRTTIDGLSKSIGFGLCVISLFVSMSCSNGGDDGVKTKTTGDVSGKAIGLEGPSTNPVTISGNGEPQTLSPNSDGNFALGNMEPGDYTASTIFNGDVHPTTVNFKIVVNQTITIELTQEVPSFVKPRGTNASGGIIKPGATLSVDVTDFNSGSPLAGATVIVDSVDGRQIDTTASTVTFTIASGGPVTVTVAKSGYDFLTLIDINAINLHFALTPLGLTASVIGTASNIVGPNVNLSGTSNDTEFSGDFGIGGTFTLDTDLPNRIYSLSAFDFGSNPTNFAAVIDIGPLTNGQILQLDFSFPANAPATTITSGTITVPTTIGAGEVTAVGLKDLGQQGLIVVGMGGTDTTASRAYSLTTFDFPKGSSEVVGAFADEGDESGEVVAIRRGIGFGGEGVDFALINAVTNLSPLNLAACDGLTPTFSWTGVPGASYYGLDLGDTDTSWSVIIAGNATNLTLPDLSGTGVEALGLSSGDPVSWGIDTYVVPGFEFNSYDGDTALKTYTDASESIFMNCTP